jgi:cytochrome P450
MSIAKPPAREFEEGGSFVEDDPFVYHAGFSESAPFWTEADGGAWVVTRFADTRRILQDPGTFSSVNQTPEGYEMEQPLLPSFSDPPELQKYRGILLPSMTSAKVAPLEENMRVVCKELIDSFASSGHCDAVADFARKYPIAIFTAFFGLPQGRSEEFRQCAHTYLHNSPAEREVAWDRIRGIVREQIELKRSDPAEDLLSAIATGTIDGELAELDVAVNLASTVFLGGLDTLPSNIGWSLRYLADHPDLRHRIAAEPTVIHSAIEEFLRRFSVANPQRRVTKDIEVGGSQMHKGDRIKILISNANRDSAEFPDPMVVDFDRSNNRHVAFGAGPHRCLGSHLARHELEVGLELWHEAIPDYRVVQDEPILYHRGVLAMENLPLEWEV